MQRFIKTLEIIWAIIWFTAKVDTWPVRNIFLAGGQAHRTPPLPSFG